MSEKIALVGFGSGGDIRTVNLSCPKDDSALRISIVAEHGSMIAHISKFDLLDAIKALDDGHQGNPPQGS